MSIHPTLIRILNDADPRPDARYVLYWMQQSQRARFNPALEYAVDAANARGLPVLVCFGLTDGYPEANARHYTFMLEGLAEVARALVERGIGFVIGRGPPDQIALDFSRDAALIVCDRGYLKPQRAWRDDVARQATCRVVQIEGDVLVPVETVSPKHEYAARTLRPRLYRAWNDYIVPLEPRPVRCPALGLTAESSFDLTDVPRLVRSLKVDQGVAPVRRFQGGTGEAWARLERFLDEPFARYAKNRSKPEAGAASHMSPYLHFGQISPVEIALAIREAGTGDDEDRSAYLEELIVRRELAMNHVYYDEKYDTYETVPEWARRTLDSRRTDKRPYLYEPGQLERGETHDRNWNAAMLEMRATGYMHNHLRMYWGKKILEGSPSPREAFKTTLRLNNRYFLDGRDANSFTNVAWVFGLHDRPWGPQPVFGNVRSMGQNTFKKFDAEAYVRTVGTLALAEERAR
ncbi:MAG: deoxyribodipyrimidine photo-lyase [Microvirga sp.]